MRSRREPVRLGRVLPVVMKDIERRMQQNRRCQRVSQGQPSNKFAGSVTDGRSKFQNVAV